MKLTINNYKEYVQNKDWALFEALLIDLEELNQLLEDKNEDYRKLYIDFENEHTQYSPERVDPCPDFYGFFSLRFEKNPYEIVGDYMTIEELDSIMADGVADDGELDDLEDELDQLIADENELPEAPVSVPTAPVAAAPTPAKKQPAPVKKQPVAELAEEDDLDSMLNGLDDL